MVAMTLMLRFMTGRVMRLKSAIGFIEPSLEEMVLLPIMAEHSTRTIGAVIVHVAGRTKMTTYLQPYPAYKPSGVDWLDDVPTHWEVLPGRACYTSEQILNHALVEKTVLSLSYGQIKIRPEERLHGLVPASFETYQLVEPGDIICRPTDLQNDWNSLRFGLSRRRGIITSAYMCLRTRAELSRRYGYLLLHTYDVKKVFYGLGSGLRQNLSWTDFKLLPCPVPPLPEQAAIVRYLDHVDRRIRRYVSAKRKLIALLEEEKQAVINRAVTRGLDANVRLKPSGVEWLGDVPEHWEMRRGKRLFSPRRELAKPDDIQLSATQAYGVIPQDEYEERIGRRIVKISLHLNQRRHVEVDDFVISMRSFQGGLERAWSSGCIRSSYIVLRPAIEVDVEFFSYVFKSQAYIQALRSTANFIRDGQDLTFDNFCAVDLPFPPAEEQRKIAVALREAASDISAGIARACRQIDLVQEYRTRLIADVVTGKLDVREAAAQLPDESDDEEPIDEGRALADDADGDLYDTGNFKEELAMEEEVSV